MESFVLIHEKDYINSREGLYEPSGFKVLASRHAREAYPLIRLNHIGM